MIISFFKVIFANSYYAVYPNGQNVNEGDTLEFQFLNGDSFTNCVYVYIKILLYYEL